MYALYLFICAYVCICKKYVHMHLTCVCIYVIQARVQNIQPPYEPNRIG